MYGNWGRCGSWRENRWFPYDEDYEEDLESKIADIKQCNLEGGPDHIHAARFLGRFVENNVHGFILICHRVIARVG